MPEPARTDRSRAVRLLVEAGNASVGVEDGILVPPDGRFDLTLRVPDGRLRPGGGP